MLYVRDLWVNWFDGEENGYNVGRFHEWRKEDGIELVDQIPLLHVTPEFFKFVEDDLATLPTDFLSDIEDKSYIKKDQRRRKIKYAAVISDGNDVIAFDTVGMDVPAKKTRLIPRQERLVLEMVAEKEASEYKVPEGYKKQYHFFSFEPSFVSGLTRRERRLKEILAVAVDELNLEESPMVMNYWLTEWNPAFYQDNMLLTRDEAYKKLKNETQTGWSKFHEEFTENLIKGHSFLESEWETEQKFLEKCY